VHQLRSVNAVKIGVKKSVLDQKLKKKTVGDWLTVKRQKSACHRPAWLQYT